MNDDIQYAVYLHPGALEALGEPIKPFLTQGPNGAHIVCTELDTGGALCEMKVRRQDGDGRAEDIEVMVPISMVLLVVAIGALGDRFGFQAAPSGP